MSIDLKTVKHISKLSRISLDDKKAEKLTSDLNAIFSFIEKLKLRKDEIKSGNIRDEVLKNSPDKNKDFFVVPKVVE